MTYKVTIDGRAIPFGDHQWRLTAGVLAPLQGFRVPNEIAVDLLAKKIGEELTIVLDKAVVERAILLGNAACNDPLNQILVFTDVRWYLMHKWMVFGVNEQRRTGGQVLIGNALGQAALNPLVQYRPWSLNNSTPWTWDTLTSASLAFASIVEGRAPIKCVVEAAGLPNRNLVVQETKTDSNVSRGLARALLSVPGKNVFVDLKGTLHVYNALPGSEFAMVNRLRELSLTGHGDLTWKIQDGSRPKDGYRAYFTPQLEVRLDYDTAPAQQAVSPPGIDSFFLEEVIQSPDLTLAVPAGRWGPARTVGQGTWLTPPEIFPAWGAPNAQNSGGLQLPALTDPQVCALYLSDKLRNLYVTADNIDPDVIWDRRITAVYANWRSYFRVNPRAWERVLDAQTVMAAVWDTVTGLRAPSAVYVNLARKPSARWNVANIQLLSMRDAKSYPLATKLLKNGAPAPVTVEIVDMDQGILRLVPHRDPTGSTSSAEVSDIVGDASMNPFTNPSHVLQAWSTRILVPDDQFKVALILSLTPAAPNDTRRLYNVRVSLAEAAAALGLPNAPKAAGPIMELRTNNTAARFAYLDETAAQTLAYFGLNAAGVGYQAQPGAPELTSKPIQPVNLATEILPLAKALAGASLYYHLDHYEGNVLVPQDPNIVPLGSVSEVVHRVTRSASQTLVTAAPIFASSPSPFDLLPASVRDALLHLVAKQAA